MECACLSSTKKRAVSSWACMASAVTTLSTMSIGVSRVRRPGISLVLSGTACWPITMPSGWRTAGWPVARTAQRLAIHCDGIAEPLAGKPLPQHRIDAVCVGPLQGAPKSRLAGCRVVAAHAAGAKAGKCLLGQVLHPLGDLHNVLLADHNCGTGHENHGDPRVANAAAPTGILNGRQALAQTIRTRPVPLAELAGGHPATS